jgi:lysophospholipid acyltransferase (LPLAT)-like uncharacterized protein
MSKQQSKKAMQHQIILFFIPLACLIIRLLMLTVRVKLIDPHGLAPQHHKGQPVIYAFWHNQQLLATSFFRQFAIRVLVSRSKDGDYIAKVLHHFGFATVRSSTSQGKINALRGLARELNKGYHAAITPDGPRGPLYQAQPGAVFLAALSGQAIAPFGCAVDKTWCLKKTWDQFEIPKPFSQAVIVYGEAMTVPRKLEEQTSESLRLQLQNKLTTLRSEALQQLNKAGR